ncbi:hypothetical protein BXZ70DRAFT_924530 [Cristinia sonorae]|uniref:BTB domain-containing protein n=1 Tax=Cristinia sonorae TaxID=1940300 RepID=A0A8K0XSW6_9AGAR|nr:hypothetical protein BXZ70DRAFT_924530 [Cristinia sonorae]
MSTTAPRPPGSGSPTGEVSVSGPHTALAPFNKSSANVVIRSSDHVDFYVQKSILAEASSVFEAMFEMPQDFVRGDSSSDQEYRDGLPIICLSEPSTTIDNLLRFCYPASQPKLTSGHEVCDVLEAARKYFMDPIIADLQELFAKHADTEPFRMYALAAARGNSPDSGWDTEVKTAARLSLRKQFPVGTYIPEMSAMNVRDYVLLQKYHENCRLISERCLVEALEGDLTKKGSKWKVTCLALSLYRRPEEGKWFSHQCSHARDSGVIDNSHHFRGNPGGLILALPAPRWFMEYLAAVCGLLKKDPRKEALLDSNILYHYVSKGKLNCQECAVSVTTDLPKIHALLADDFETRWSIR